MKDQVSPVYNPKLSHCFYFIRKGLYEGIKENAHFLDGKLMDFGCGEKPYRSLLPVDEYVGVDFENEGYSHENMSIDVYYDGKTIPFPDNHFDCILSTEVFEHVFDIDLVLNELRRVLRPGGRMLITCPFVWNEHQMPFDFARYTSVAVKHIFDKHNFEVIKFEKKGDFVRTIFQLCNIYVHNQLSIGGLGRVPVVRGVAARILPAAINIIGIFMAKMLPKYDDLYLSNIILVEKK